MLFLDLPFLQYDQNVCFHSECKGDPSEKVFWIQCEICEKWYHWLCLGLSKKDVEGIDHYNCEGCAGLGNVVSTDQGQAEVAHILSDVNQFIIRQQSDPVISGIKKQLLDNDLSHPKYVMAEGLVKYVDNNSHSNKVVVPGELVVEVIAHHHCTPTSPHLGMRKTISKIREKFYWKNLKSDVETFVKKCRQCQLSKPMYCKPSGYMESTTSRYPWDVMAMDLLGPFPESNAGNLYILVITDHFSRFSFLMTLKRSRGKVLRAVLRQLFCTWGACNKLVSDNGPQMVSKDVAELCILWGVKRIFATPYHPQANWVERVNRNIVSMLCCFVKADVHTDWDVHVPVHVCFELFRT
ncbi:Retrotransposable element Tf2 protein type 2 [Apostichopus japonicus]|uniref:Retrotransposable element Tf2 protein type 2 n=1 Tax=Stichopus japonicus TaxID=307972 RepID=A0A2G8LQ91_STIJA|nr:Retrotransposable element Tf2 protein type 2 [Apostichopus japonicus]